ncbi:hypothetical protein DFH28DRAFT_880849, partial [Melampsora americana]
QPPTARTTILTEACLYTRKDTEVENRNMKSSALTGKAIRLNSSEEDEQPQSNKEQEVKDQENQITEVERLNKTALGKRQNRYIFLSKFPSDTHFINLFATGKYQLSFMGTATSYKGRRKDSDLISNPCGHHYYHHQNYLSNRPQALASQDPKSSMVLSSTNVTLESLKPKLSLPSQFNRTRTQPTHMIHEIEYQDNRRNFLIGKAFQYKQASYNSNQNYNLIIRSSCQICFQSFYTLDLLYKHISLVHSRHSKFNHSYFT